MVVVISNRHLCADITSFTETPLGNAAVAKVAAMDNSRSIGEGVAHCCVV